MALSIEQQKALALAKARQMQAQQQPAQPEMTSLQLAQQANQQPFDIAKAVGGVGQNIVGGAETALALGSGIVAEPLAGLAGLGASLNPFAEEGAAARNVEIAREFLTVPPKTQAGKRLTQAVGESLAPVGESIKELESDLGDVTLDVTGSPTLAAAAATLPTAALEAMGVSAGRSIAKAKTGLPGTPTGTQIQKTTPKQVETALVESAPDIQKIKDASRAVYKEIDDLGVTLKPGAYKGFTGRILALKNKLRVNKRRTPEAAGVLDEFRKDFNSPEGRTVTDMEELRRIAADLSGSINKADAAVGARMLDEIDDFMDTVPSGAFTGVNAKDAANVGKRYQAARQLWGRARRAELISDAMDKAGRQASGFENGIRVQFRQILNNKKRSKFFTKEELRAMDEVVKGTSEQNISKLIGRLGLSEGQATNILGGMSGTLLGGAVAGPGGAAAIPAIGQFFRSRAQKLTARNAALSDAIVRSKNNAQAITEAYLKTVKPENRKVSDLSDILTDPDIDVTPLLESSNRMTREAAEIAKGRQIFIRAQALGAAAPVAVDTAIQQGATSAPDARGS